MLSRPVLFYTKKKLTIIIYVPSAFDLKGRAIFASGSPFDPFEYNGKVFVPGQVYNHNHFAFAKIPIIIFLLYFLIITSY